MSNSQNTRRVVVDPVTRIEGHLRVQAEIDANGVITDAMSTGTMWRGLEVILKGRDPRDAWAFVERICGVCTGIHALAAVRAVEDAIGIKIPKNANIIRNLMNATLYVQDHLVHFYQLSALDWVDVVSALSADWSYAWSIDPGEPGSLVLALHTPVNVASAEITSVTVTAAGGRAETLDLQAAGADDEARIRETVGADAALLDAVRGAHAFQAGASYTIGFTAVLTKANGAQETVTDTFQVQLPAA